MRISLPYGRTKVTLEFPDKNLLGVLQAHYGAPQDKTTHVAKKIREPFGPSLTELSPDSNGKVLLLVNDHTRQEDRITVLDQITPHLSQYDIMIATGTHRATTEKELGELLGQYYLNPKGQVLIHDCHHGLTRLGETKRETPVYVDSRVLGYDLVIPVGVIEPHYFAGYAGPLGCCKSLSVGVAGYQTVEHNHKMAIEPKANCGRFEDNPLAQDLSEIAGIIEEKVRLFCVGNLLHGWEVIDVFAGGRLEAFQPARSAMDAATRIQPEAADILIVSQGGYPRDLDLYQSQKSVEHTKYAVKPGGQIIWLAECRFGLGPELDRIPDVLEKPADTIMADIKDHYRLGMHKIYRMLQVSQRAKINLFSMMNGAMPRALDIAPTSDPQRLLSTILRENPGATINIAPEGCEIFIAPCT